MAAPALTPWRRWHLASDDIDAPAEGLPGCEQIGLQLESGAFESVVDGVRIGDELGLCRRRTNRRLHATFATSPGICALALLMPASEGILVQHRPVRRGEVLVLPPGQAFDVVTLGRFDVTVVAFDAGRWPSVSDGARRCSAAILSESPATRRLADAMRSILEPEDADTADAARRQPGLAARLECHLVECLGERDRSADATAECGPGAVIDAARRVLLSETEQQGQVPPVPELAARLGISVRQLHRLFHERLGLSPRAYAERLRLSRARFDLRHASRGEVTVAAIATKWGFWHLGRFASSYREAFGELPSHTARA